MAHIRHRHTRYDALLKETTWQHARKTVEAVCLDMIVKWRGDEENGRDTLDSILREVVVISDSEGDDESDADDSDELVLISPQSAGPRSRDVTASAVSNAMAVVNLGPPRQTKNAPTAKQTSRKTPTTPARPKRTAKALRRERKAAKKATRGFKRYQDAWEKAVDRNRHEQETGDVPPSAGLAPQRSPGYVAHASTRPDYNTPLQPPRPNSHVIYVGPAGRSEPTNLEPVRVDGSVPTRTPNCLPDAQISPRPVQHRVGGTHAPIMTRSLTNPPMPVRGSQGSRYQDLLVPSIEGPAPTAMAPQFVRALPPRKHARDESPGYPAGYPPPQPYTPVHPTEPVQDGHVKRRRVISDRDSMEVPRLDPYSRNPLQPHHGYTQREPEIRPRVSYPTLDSARGMRNPAPSQVYYERRPEPVGMRQHPIALQQPIGAVSQNGESMELRTTSQEQPSYPSYHPAERIPEPRGDYRGVPAPVFHADHHNHSPRASHYSGHQYQSGHYEPRQVQRPTAQPIFVRTVEPRIAEVQPRGATREGRYATPGDTVPSQRWEEVPASRANYPTRGHSLEP